MVRSEKIPDRAIKRARVSANAHPAQNKEKVLAYSKRIPRRLRGLFLSTKCGGVTKRLAIKAMCQQCMGYSDYIEGIRGCDSIACPLWAYRPYQKAPLNQRVKPPK